MCSSGAPLRARPLRLSGHGSASIGRLGVVVVAAVLASACPGQRAKPPVLRAPTAATGPATVRIGDCAEPGADGVVSGSIRPRRADRDLDDDGRPEVVVADLSICSQAGNCYWNLFASPRGGCQRYLGTIAGLGIERMGERGDEGFRDLRGWWKMAGGGRFLVQQYRFGHGGYRLVEVLVCRQTKGDRLLCAEDGR